MVLPEIAAAQCMFTELLIMGLDVAVCQVDLKTQEAQGLQEQRDQYYSHLQQYTVAYQHLAAEKEELHKQFLLQTQLMDRLQHEEVQGKVTVEMHLKELQQTKVREEELDGKQDFVTIVLY